MNIIEFVSKWDRLLYLAATPIVWFYYRRKTVEDSAHFNTLLARFWAAAIDYCLLWPVWWVIGSDFIFKRMGLGAIALLLLKHCSYWFYRIAMHGRFGMTVGKMACNLKVVVNADGNAISYKRAFLREGASLVITMALVGCRLFVAFNRGDLLEHSNSVHRNMVSPWIWIPPTIPAIWFIMEFVTMLWNRRRRALHDFIAGTVVMRFSVKQLAPEHGIENMDVV